MTYLQMNAAKKSLPRWENGRPPVLTPEQKLFSEELSCRSMINSVLCYHGPDNLMGNRYIAEYAGRLGAARVAELCDEQLEDFKLAVVCENVSRDGEGLSYNAIHWADEMLDEVVKLAMQELDECGSVGYTLPDGKYHIFIYVDDDGYYIAEPNKVVDGAHEPLGDTTAAKVYDYNALAACCEWCFEEFARDRGWVLAKDVSFDDMLLSAQEKSAGSSREFEPDNDVDFGKE